MIGGKEALHRWTPPGAAEPAVVLGQRLKGDVGDAPATDEVWPRFTITRISGLHALGAAEDNRDPRVGGTGSIARPSQRREKQVTYEGWIRARSLRELREGRDLLAEAFAEVETEGRMDVFWHPDNTEFEDLPPVFYEARPVLCDIPEEQEVRDWKRRFVLGLVMGDPRYFEEETEVYTAELTETNTGAVFS